MITVKDQELHVSGKITFENAENYYQNGLKLIQQSQQFPLTFDLSALESGSTLALAVLVRWLREAPSLTSLQFKAVPEKMMKIIQSCHLENDLKLI